MEGQNKATVTTKCDFGLNYSQQIRKKRIENLEIDPPINEQLIFKNVVKAIQYEKITILYKWQWNN